ncbi:PaaI family thioesterase [Blattabacterium cuenoti]|uniref:PaaI family thioesterase n=1 Tax=Blattabacterium cuenoti TaxID=1653831 RepID=UPI00374D04EF
MKKKKISVFNIEISVNNIKYVKNGTLFAKAKILHKGKTIHFIRIHIFNKKDESISFCKMTNIIIRK